MRPCSTIRRLRSQALLVRILLRFTIESRGESAVLRTALALWNRTRSIARVTPRDGSFYRGWRVLNAAAPAERQKGGY